MLNNILEISKRVSKGGRVPIKIALLKIHDDPSETNKNGIHWKEEYVLNAIESAKGMPICATFLDETKTVPFDHGLTGEYVDENGVHEPLFENSEVVGIIENANIEEIIVGEETIKSLVGTGFLYLQRYKNFVEWVRENFALSNVDTSIEIMGLEVNGNKIIYEEENPTDKYRSPKVFQFTGDVILAVPPAEDTAIVLEVAQNKNDNKEETVNMDEKELKALVQSTIAESNSKNDELNAKIEELNSQIVAKDNTISELNATVEQVRQALDDLQKEHETYWAEREALEKELGELKAKARLGELNSAIENFTDDEKKYAEAEINAFKEKPLEGDVNSIVSKIYAGIGQAQKQADTDAKIAELNSKKEDEKLDIFAEVNSVEDDDEDVNIF